MERIEIEKGRKILVLGGSYFAGRVFVEEYLKHGGTDITVFNRGRMPLNMPDVREIKGDRDNQTDLRQLAGQHWDYVVDFCAYEPQQIQDVMQVIGKDIEHYIMISTTSVYEENAREVIKEGAAKISVAGTELNPCLDYQVNKLRCEERTKALALDYGFSYTLMRPSIIYGYYNYAPRETLIFESLYKKQPIVIPSQGDESYSFIWVTDMAHQLLMSLGNEDMFGQAYNMASAEKVSYQSIIDSIEAILGKSVSCREMTPADIEREAIEMPFPVGARLLYDNAKLTRQLEFKYTSFELGLRQSLQYFVMVRRQAQTGA